jgi:predicted dehydrogenase
MTAAADAAASRGVFAMCGFTYRRTPALTLAKRLVDKAALGDIRHVRAQYLQDWLTDENVPLTWRLDKAKSGSGALGDIGAHIIDAAQWISGQTITGVSGLLETFVKERPVGGDFVGLGGHGGAQAPLGAVTVDDSSVFSARFADDEGSAGAIGVFEATRFALGRKNAIRLELNGTRGSLAFDLEDMNSLWLYDASEAPNAGFRRILVTEPEHPYIGNWWPAGHGLGYEHAFTHQVVDLVEAIWARKQPTPSFADALQVQRVLEAVEKSAADESRWTKIAGA